MKYVLIFSVVLGAILLFLLAAASGNTAVFSQHYPLLLALNAALALALLALVGYQLWLLWTKLRARVFGSRLTLRFVLMFLPMVIVPGGLVYVVSLQFLSKSIESWFDVRVDNALEGGLNLGRTALEHLLTELNQKARGMALELSDKPAVQQAVLLNRLREQAGADEALLLTSNGIILASASKFIGKLMPTLPNPTILRQARVARGYSAIEGGPDKDLFLRVLTPVGALSLAEDERILQLIQPVPQSLAKNAEAVQAVYRDYKELSLSRQGLKEIYILTLTLALLLTLFSATALAFLLSARLSEPLARLAEGTQAVARGDYSRRVQVTSSDELGILTESFNSMTEQLDQLIQAQRASAWAEVSRRLAHEIKNPLTPIQLSAERLQEKLAGKLTGEDAATLRRATETIVNQVTAMKEMVDDFSAYARKPAAVLVKLDLNALLNEVLGLYEHAGALVRPALQDRLPPVAGDPTQLRQVIHNLLQNAQDALGGNPDARIEVQTSHAGNQIRLRISDNGTGFPATIMERVFEPYVTTKPKGTGLGLAIVKKIIDEHKGTIGVENKPGRGASVTIALPEYKEAAEAA